MRKCLIPILLVFLTGCDINVDSGTNPAGSGAVGSDAPAGTINAEDATGIWNQSEVQQYITEELKLSSVTLTSTGNGNYTAQGAGADGTQYDITIEQKPGGIRYQWTAAEGKAGSGAFGTFVEQ